MPTRIKRLMKNLHADTLSRYYGCGLCLPDYDLTGTKVLDLGCGAGRDVYLASQLVGPQGHVVGVDMTEAQLTAAREKQSYHAEKFGYDNVEFVKGYLEELDTVLIGQAGTFDLIISNCVLNLCTDKKKVLTDCFALLKEGGELYFSDVYCNRRVPIHLRNDAVLYGECISGALYWNDFQNMAQQVGFTDPRLVEDAPITIGNKKIQQKVAGYDFYSATYRLWKNKNLEPDCEDFGQAVIYKGGLVQNDVDDTNKENNTGSSDYSTWKLDKGHVFVKGKVHPVCGNTYHMLQDNDKIAKYFDFIGDFSTHFGIFPGCGGAVGLPYDQQPTGTMSSSSSSGGGCC
jgi:arsenite methyltransferase